tara:strand:- start:150 stop:344 length:195 start_codon:yes stop_codon:yes gene_type:complete
MDCFKQTYNKESNDNSSLEEHSTNLELLCDISQFCCSTNMNEYIDFIKLKLEKKNNNTKTNTDN